MSFLYFRRREKEKPPAMESRTVIPADDNFEVLDTDAEGTDAFAAYFAEANKACDREVTTSKLASCRAIPT